MACGVVSCAVLREEFGILGTPRETAAEPPAAKDLPTIIAIMHFQNQTAEPGAAERVRKEFYNLFSSKSYVDIEPSLIDEKIVHLERDKAKKVTDLKPAEVCEAIGCDGLIFGSITAYEKIYMGVYSQLGAAAEIWMVDAKTEKEVLRVKDSVSYYEGDIPLTPLGAIITALSTAANVRELQEVRLVNELTYKLLQQIPEPEGAPAVRRPKIRTVIANASDSPFGRGETVKVGLYGEPGVVASFDIGNFRKGVPMKESQAGVYLGEYAVLPGDDTSDMPIIAHLKRPSGAEGQWVYTNGLITIDTTAPPKVMNLRAGSFKDGVELAWDYPQNVPDLAGYLVLRSGQPLSGFKEVAKVELNAYEDRDIIPEGVFYYRIVAIDGSGNRSEFSATDTLQSRMPSNEPAVLSGEIQSDTVLSGIYSLRNLLTVPLGLSLTIGPATIIMAEPGAGIRVQGKLIVDGLNGQVRLFARKNQRWTGVTVESGHVEMRGFLLSGAATGVMLHDTMGVVENAAIIGNDTGISISGTSPVVVRDCWVAGNKTGIGLTGTGAKVLNSVIIDNVTGQLLRYFIGEVRDNLILDNEQNTLTDAP
jgi:hypothetical protein